MKAVSQKKEIKAWKIIGSFYYVWFAYFIMLIKQLSVVIFNNTNEQYIHPLAVNKYLLRISYEPDTVLGAECTVVCNNDN